jgi:hypothetical protein
MKGKCKRENEKEKEKRNKEKREVENGKIKPIYFDFLPLRSAVTGYLGGR